jgi:hypothetical protein
MRVRISDAIAFPVPAANEAPYRPTVGKDLVLGLRPEHITEPRHNGRDNGRDFTASLDVVEPMGMETISPSTAAKSAAGSSPAAAPPMRLYANTDTCT